MIIGYAWTSTLEQRAGLQAQKRELRAAGVEKVYAEQTSSVGQRNASEVASVIWKWAEAANALSVGVIA